jgi:uncharacterized protein (DUF1697 family)
MTPIKEDNMPDKTYTLEEQILEEIESLQEQSQQRLNVLAQGDAVWANLQGQITALNTTLGKLKKYLDEKPIEKNG